MLALPTQQKQYIGLQYIMDLLDPDSAYGKEKLQKALPYGPKEQEELQRQLDNIEKTLLARPRLEREYKRLQLIFTQVRDIRKSILKCQKSVLGEVDLFEIKRYLLQLTEITPLFLQINNFADYSGIAFADTEEALKLLDPEENRVASFYISNRYSAKLTQIRNHKRAIEEQLRKLPFKEIPADLLAERQQLALQEEKEEQLVREELTRKLKPFAKAMINNAENIGELDLLIQKAAIAHKYGGVKPVISSSHIYFTNMRHPHIAAILNKENKPFTPITIRLNKGAAVITGANMGGKSVALTTTALNITLIHYGIYPFAEAAATPLFDYMHIICGSLESIEHGLSRFGGQVIRFNEIVQDINKGFTCVFIDEFAHGTNPREGASIAAAITEYLNESNAISLLTTHYDKVAEYANAHYQMIGLKQLDADKLQKEAEALPNRDKVSYIAHYMNYNLVLVENKQKPPRDALKICHLLGMPAEILAKIKDEN